VNAGGGTFITGGAVSASTISNAATFNTTGGTVATTGGFTNSGAYTQTAGTLSGGFTNNPGGTVVVSGGAMNGAIVNNDSFTVSGTVTTDSAFTNNAAGTLAIAGTGNYSVGGLLTNSGLITVAAGGTLLANSPGITNTATGTITNSGTITDDLDNAGVATNNAGATWNATVNTNTGVITNAGTWNGGVTSNAALIDNTATGTWNGAVATNAGTIDTAGTWNGNINNSSGTVNLTGGAINGTIANTGAFNASGGATNGAVTNGVGGAFTVTGAVTSNGSTFANNGLLAINAGSYTGLGAISTAGTVTTAAGTTLSGTSYAQTGGQTTNAGTIAATTGAVTNNGGIFINSGTVTAATSLDNTAGTFTNTGTATATTTGTNGGVFNLNAGTVTTGGDFTNTGIFNLNAGTMASAGALGFVNNATVNAAGGAIGATVNNNAIFNLSGNVAVATAFNNNAGGTFTFFGTPTLTVGVGAGNFASNGLITVVVPPGSPAGTLPSATANLTIAGALTGNGTINTVVNGGDASLVTVTGSSAGNQSFTFNNTTPGGAIPVFNSPKAILDLNGGGLNVANKGVVGSLSNGLINNFLVQGGAGQDAFLQTAFNDGPISGLASGVSSIIATLSSGFFQAAASIVSRPDNPHANQIGGGPFVRVSAGDSTTSLNSSLTAFGPANSSHTNASTNFSGIQAGFDVGVYNINSSDWNVNLGFFGGYVNARGYATTASPVPTGGSTLTGTQVTLDVPYVALYTFISRRSFTAEINVRQDFYKGNVNSYNGDLGFGGGYLVAPNTSLTGKGTSVNVNVSNRFDLSDTVYVEPLAGFTWGRYSFDDVYFNPNLSTPASSVQGRMAFAPIESYLGRVGANLGGTFLVSDNLAIAPFVHTSVWREFGSAAATTAFVSTGANSFAFPGSVDRVGTFGQVGVGFQFKVLNLDLLGFARGDMRFGDSLNGKAINIGLRKQF